MPTPTPIDLPDGHVPTPPEVAPRLLSPRFAALLCAQFCFGFCFSVFLLLPKFLVMEFGATATEVGWATAVAPLSALLCVPLVGGWLDRGGRRGLIIGGALMMALASSAFVMVDRVGPLLFGLRVLQGASFTLAFNAAAMLTVDLAPGARLGQALGILGVSNLVTNAIAPAVVEPLARAHGWIPVFWLASGCALLAVLLAFLLPDPRSRLPARPAAHIGRRGWALVYVSAMMGAAFGTVITFVQPMALAMGVQEIGGLFIGYTVAAVLVRVVLGSVADRFGRQRVAILALALYTLVVAAAAGLRPSFIVALGAGLGFAHGLSYPALSALAVEGALPEQRGRTITYFNGGFNGGFAACSFAFGAVASVAGYPTVFLLAASLCATGVLLVVRLPSGAGVPSSDRELRSPG